jgi:acetoin utilization deacetylase AcuC-like enzyme
MTDIALFYPQGHQAHYERSHPERPERVETIRRALETAGVWDTLLQIHPRQIPDSVLHAVHRPAYLQILEEACRRGMHLDADTYTTSASWQLAFYNAGGAVELTRQVWTGEVQSGFALTRPPGHHATSTQGMGFCLLNNVALAAEYLLQEENADRIAIVDLDLHHGNGTQEIFWERSEIFYLSTHQSPFYPGSGYLRETGAGEGENHTANFPLPPGSGDQAFETVMESLILPLLDRFRAQIVLVSVGFDPHWRDPLGSLLMSSQKYFELILDLKGWAERNCAGRLALFLEGGYDLQAGASCGLASLAALRGTAFEDQLGAARRQEGTQWQEMARAARQIWRL